MILLVSGAHDSVSINIHSFFVPDRDTARDSICSAQEKKCKCKRKCKCKFNRTLYNTQLIQFARIPAEFVVHFIRYQYRVKVMTFSIAAKYLLLISPYSLRVQCLELYTACILDR